MPNAMTPANGPIPTHTANTVARISGSIDPAVLKDALPTVPLVPDWSYQIRSTGRDGVNPSPLTVTRSPIFACTGVSVMRPGPLVSSGAGGAVPSRPTPAPGWGTSGARGIGVVAF